MITDSQNSLPAAVAERADRFSEQAGYSLTASARRVIGLSDFAARVARLQPEWFASVSADGTLDMMSADTDLKSEALKVVSQVNDINDLKRVLRRLRDRRQFWVVWRHLLNLATFEETTTSLTNMADILINTALGVVEEWERKRHGIPLGDKSGQPQRLIVFGLGKLGGRELNLSSDVDLIYAFPEPGKTPSGISSQNFFIRVGQRLIDALHTVTQDGFVFRVDMRLRAYGNSGPLAMHLSAMRRYLETEGRDWERYAYIKARACAGDIIAGQEFLKSMQPFVYRRYLDFGSIESMRDIKALQDNRREADDIKLGVGGIRDAEFTVQVQQLIRGGQHPPLRRPAFLHALAELSKLEIFTYETVEHLQLAYRFLRHSEHSIQAESDRQTQRLPANDLGRLRLALSHGFDSYEQYLVALGEHRSRVEIIFDQLLVVDAPDVDSDLWVRRTDLKILSEAGFSNASEASHELLQLAAARDRHSVSDTGRTRLNELMPRLIEMIVRSSNPDRRLKYILPILRDVLRRSTYLAFLRDNPSATERLVRLAGDSKWLADQFRLRPMFLDLLHDSSLSLLANPPPERGELIVSLGEKLADNPDEERLLDELRAFKEKHVFQVVLAQAIGVLPLMLASDYLTFLAEAMLEQTTRLAWENMEKRYPDLADPSNRSLVVIGYGKLGGIELAPGSDLDLVFIHDLLDAKIQLAYRLVRKLLSLLTVQTYYGPLYDVDIRLRPSGSAGPMVTSLSGFEHYQKSDALVWEHQALVRARAVAGDQDLCRRFEQTRVKLLCQKRDKEALRDQIVKMRDRMTAHHAADDDLKLGIGGVVDIEFIVQYLVLAHAQEIPKLATYSDNIRILEMAGDVGVLDRDDADQLTWAYMALRAQMHQRMMDLSDENLDEEVMNSFRDTVKRVWEMIFGASRLSVMSHR